MEFNCQQVLSLTKADNCSQEYNQTLRSLKRREHSQGQVSPESSCLFSSQLRSSVVDMRALIPIQRHRYHLFVNELEYIMGPGPWKFCGPFKAKWKEEKLYLFSDSLFQEAENTLQMSPQLCVTILTKPIFGSEVGNLFSLAVSLTSNWARSRSLILTIYSFSQVGEMRRG